MILSATLAYALLTNQLTVLTVSLFAANRVLKNSNCKMEKIDATYAIKMSQRNQLSSCS